MPVIVEQEDGTLPEEEEGLYNDDASEDRHTDASDDSAGNNTFGRTPEHSDNEESDCKGATPIWDSPPQGDTPTKKRHKQGQPTCQDTTEDVPLQELNRTINGTASTADNKTHLTTYHLTPLRGGKPSNELSVHKNRPLPPIAMKAPPTISPP